MALPHLLTVPHSPLKVKMVTTAYEGMTVSYLRYKVFIEEQGIAVDEEFDGSDTHSVSFLFFLDHVPIATMRYFKDEQGIIHPGRIAVLKPYRGQGHGKTMMRWFDQYITGLYPEVTIQLHAQQHLEKLYRELGYKVIGAPFMEANIPHLTMEKKLKRVTS
ncbi:MAG: GNAT family N-acetyltransferase [Bacilli bacterium]